MVMVKCFSLCFIQYIWLCLMPLIDLKGKVVRCAENKRTVPLCWEKCTKEPSPVFILRA